MNKINSMHSKTGFSSWPPKYFPSLTSSVKSDTNMGTKGSFLESIPSPLISLRSLLDHKVRAGIKIYSYLFHNLSYPILQNCNESYNESYTFFVTFGSMVEGYFGC